MRIGSRRPTRAISNGGRTTVYREEIDRYFRPSLSDEGAARESNRTNVEKDGLWVDLIGRDEELALQAPSGGIVDYFIQGPTTKTISEAKISTRDRAVRRTIITNGGGTIGGSGSVLMRRSPGSREFDFSKQQRSGGEKSSENSSTNEVSSLPSSSPNRMEVADEAVFWGAPPSSCIPRLENGALHIVCRPVQAGDGSFGNDSGESKNVSSSTTGTGAVLSLSFPSPSPSIVGTILDDEGEAGFLAHRAGHLLGFVHDVVWVGLPWLLRFIFIMSLTYAVAKCALVSPTRIVNDSFTFEREVGEVSSYLE